ncbi:hypothetical protein IU501_00445 [Nocardia otitidiscaviarum]|uniref:hypothetical protein n=1 Tax=Nocardia otitidiscaviarum TaxID=1823 RepID=UPI000693969F|nr:hypothetical protein [Nocardia otitidiscaviarum]MBF6131476.1 hypothetical protein [Nocardia otitidiscaviarum]MBF6240176.1 hypothetical protein [Nocardia otitidiscaviarum]MBF6482622.1 hypothetical protein [Nocardia otitidiscaviarum]
MIYFAMGYWIIALALIVSASGAAVGLACIRQSTKSVTARFRFVWLFVAACSIGGVGVAMPIFVSMLGVGAHGSPVRYDSMLIAVFSALSGTTVLAALVIAGRTLNWVRLGIGAAVMGAGLGSMELVVLLAVHVQGEVERNVLSIIAVYAIALVLSVAVLWFSLTVRSSLLMLGGAALWALVVTGMHYTGLVGVSFDVDHAAPTPEGVDLFSFFVPFFIIGSLALAIPITAILVAPDRRESGAVPALSPVGDARERGAAADRIPEAVR